MSSATASSSKLLKFFTNPSKIANALDWKKMRRGSIVTLDIGRNNCIGVAIASHPAYGDPIQTFKPITMKMETTTTKSESSKKQKRRILSREVINELQSIVLQEAHHDVCGFVVSWPVQKEGRCGAPCGRVLHALDSIVEEESNNSIITPDRPFCLWDGNHVTQKEDDWGRNPIYGGEAASTTKTKTVHVASVEQYEQHNGSSTTAVDIWTDFCKSHWPNLYHQQHDDDASDLDDLEAASICDADEEACSYNMKAVAY